MPRKAAAEDDGRRLGQHRDVLAEVATDDLGDRGRAVARTAREYDDARRVIRDRACARRGHCVVPWESRVNAR